MRVKNIKEPHRLRGLEGQSEAEVRRSLMGQFPSVFDMTEHEVPSAMKALRVKNVELPDVSRVPAGGIQCTFRIDQQVRDQDINETLHRLRSSDTSPESD